MPEERSSSHHLMGMVFTLLVLFIFMGTTLFGMYYYVNRILDEATRDGFTDEDLTVPASIERSFESEDPPRNIVPWDPPHTMPLHWNCSIGFQSNLTTGRIDGFEDIGAVLNLSLINTGGAKLFVEWVYIELGWAKSIDGEIGRYVSSGDTRQLRHFMLPPPDGNVAGPQLAIHISIDILIEDGLNWVRRESIGFGQIGVHFEEWGQVNPAPRVTNNPSYYFDKINGMIKDDREQVRSLVENSTLGNGNFSIQKVADAYEFVIGSLNYIPDPDTGSNQWISPMTCLSRGGGDCEDYSVLFGALVHAMGGTARVIITSGHAFNAVYLGEDLSVLDLLNDRYGMEIPFQIWEDDLGKWLLVEPQSKLVFGWFPLDVRPNVNSTASVYIYGQEEIGWGFVDSDKVSIVDIYFK
ncbi:MAG: transglutaminase domain-containing protein [Thermoplasmatota archaeon]